MRDRFRDKPFRRRVVAFRGDGFGVKGVTRKDHAIARDAYGTRDFTKLSGAADDMNDHEARDVAMLEDRGDVPARVEIDIGRIRRRKKHRARVLCARRCLDIGPRHGAAVCRNEFHHLFGGLRGSGCSDGSEIDGGEREAIVLCPTVPFRPFRKVRLDAAGGVQENIDHRDAAIGELAAKKFADQIVNIAQAK